jgi:hypothetical protein
MSDLGEALAAMTRAGASFRSARATVHRRYEGREESEPLALAQPVGAHDEWSVLLDPTGVLAGCAFTSARRAEVAGREAFLVEARPLDPHAYELDGLAVGADVYELAVDAELGLLLRAVAFVNGAERLLVELRDLELDVDLAPEDLDPDGWEDVEEPKAEHVTLAEAAARVPFALWAPAGLLDDWRMEVSLHTWDGTTSVLLQLWHAESPHSLAIAQYRGGEEEADWHPDPPEILELGGERLEVRRRTREHRESDVRLEREGTVVGLRSQTLPLESLLEVVSALRRVER